MRRTLLAAGLAPIMITASACSDSKSGTVYSRVVIDDRGHVLAQSGDARLGAVDSTVPMPPADTRPQNGLINAIATALNEITQRQQFSFGIAGQLQPHFPFGRLRDPRTLSASPSIRAWPGTGPYHRIFTNAGYDYVSGNVFLPCRAFHFGFPNNEEGYAYVGGWGKGLPEGTAYDAGFQHGQKYDDYALFIRGPGNRQVSKWPRFRCGRAVAFKFYTLSGRTLVMTAAGTTTDGVDDSIEVDYQHDPDGWDPVSPGSDKDGIVIKCMTTIAQSGLDQSVADRDGSYFGHTAGDKRPLIVWSNLVVGRIGKNGVPLATKPWTGVSADGVTYVPKLRSVGTYPNGNAIIVERGRGREAVAIDLAP